MTPPLSDQNYYDLLEVHISASKEEIQQAYDLACKTFGDQSLATYSLFANEERKAMLKRMEEAYRVLIDARSRQEYDRTLPKTPDSSGVVQRSATPAPKIPNRKELENIVNSGLEEGLSGQVLERIRTALGIPLQEVSNKTKVNIAYLQFIENDNYKGLPVEVYLRSYLIQYAQILGFDPKKISDGYIKRWKRWKESPQQQPPQSP